MSISYIATTLALLIFLLTNPLVQAASPPAPKQITSENIGQMVIENTELMDKLREHGGELTFDEYVNCLAFQYRFSYSIESRSGSRRADNNKPLFFGKTPSTKLQRSTLREFLEKLRAEIGGFQWSVDHGVINIVQVGLENDARWPLNQKVASFQKKVSRHSLVSDLAKLVPGIGYSMTYNQQDFEPGSMSELITQSKATGTNSQGIIVLKQGVSLTLRGSAVDLQAQNMTVRQLLNLFASSEEVKKSEMVQWSAMQFVGETNVFLSIRPVSHLEPPNPQ